MGVRCRGAAGPVSFAAVPMYDYRCERCSVQFEVRQSFSDDTLTVCPSEGGPVSCVAPGEGQVKKVFSGVAVSFKGDGFYKNGPRRQRPGPAQGEGGLLQGLLIGQRLRAGQGRLLQGLVFELGIVFGLGIGFEPGLGFEVGCGTVEGRHRRLAVLLIRLTDPLSLLATHRRN